MKVFINGVLYDSEETCIVLVFENDNHRKAAAQHLGNMPDREGIRMYASYPSGKEPKEIEAIFNRIENAHS